MNKIRCENENELHEIENQYINYHNLKLNVKRCRPQEEYKNNDLCLMNLLYKLILLPI